MVVIDSVFARKSLFIIALVILPVERVQARQTEPVLVVLRQHVPRELEENSYGNDCGCADGTARRDTDANHQKNIRA